MCPSTDQLWTNSTEPIPSNSHRRQHFNTGLDFFGRRNVRSIWGIGPGFSGQDFHKHFGRRPKILAFLSILFQKTMVFCIYIRFSYVKWINIPSSFFPKILKFLKFSSKTWILVYPYMKLITKPCLSSQFALERYLVLSALSIQEVWAEG